MHRTRRPVDVIALVAALATFGLTALVARSGVAPGEAFVFDHVNGLPDGLYIPLWPFMQYGMFFTIPALTVVALILRRYRLAIAMALSGVGVYLLAKVVKEVVQRGRPGVLVAHAAQREAVALNSLGFPSGHTAVAAALTMVVTPYLRGRWKLVPASLLIIVFFGRIYVSAHLPLDLFGGIALGVAAGAGANLLVGLPTAQPAPIDEPERDTREVVVAHR